MTEPKEALRITLELPVAHFRYPFTFQKRYTYPIPPYSTVLGFLTNLFNPERERPLREIKEIFEGLEIAVSGYFGSKSVNQYWFRNLSEKAHTKRFHSPRNRRLNFETEHPGGQSPIRIEVLRDVKIFIHLRGPEEKLLRVEERINRQLGEVIETPHLGRAEDIVSDIATEWVKLQKGEFMGRLNRYFWIPNEGPFKNKRLGLLQKVPFCQLDNPHDFRLFQFKEVYLNDGNFPLQKAVETFIDKELRQPVFFTKISCGGQNDPHLG